MSHPSGTRTEPGRHVMKLCTIDGCARPHKAKGLCSRHYNRAYYASDPELHRERARRWHRDNPAKAAERRRRRDPEAMRAYTKAYYRRFRLKALAHAANQRAARFGAPGRLTAEGIAARLAYFGECCWVCGSEAADTIDHVKPLAKRGPNVPANIRPACAGCNFGRTWEARR